MTGSAKQVSWAESIRRDALSAVDRLSSNFQRLKSQSSEYGEKMAESALGYNLKDAAVVKKEVVSQFQGIKSASTIIDARNALTQRGFEEMARAEHRTGEITAARKRRK